jgi:hypothetical protein
MILRPALLSLLVFLACCSAGCGDVARARRTVREVGAETLRKETLAVCREGFRTGGAVKIPEKDWPASVRPFAPVSLWAEPDGAYLLIESDMQGEHGVYLPRILSEQDPLCTPALKHEKLGPGVYWYDRQRN